MALDVYGSIKGNLYNKGRRVSYRYSQAEIGLLKRLYNFQALFLYYTPL